MTGFKSKRQAAQAKVQEEMQAVFTKRQAAQAKLDDDDMLTIVYAQGFADGKRSAQRKPLTEEDLRKLADKHLFYQPEGYEVSGIYNLARAIEAAHNIKEGT
jgi:hypothetical protein